MTAHTKPWSLIYHAMLIVNAHEYYIYRKVKILSKLRMTWNGLWLLIMLLYTDAVMTSVFILNCPLLEDSDGNKKLVCVLILAVRPSVVF